jgi:DNA (cytosine-5)-methyltransferase 1
MPTMVTSWYTKSRRAQNVDDYETWVEGGVMPTLNSFDNGDVRTTILITTASVIGSLQARDYKGVGNQYVAENKLIIAVPIHDKATRFAGKRQMHDGTYKEDGAGNGLGVGKEGDPMNTLTGGDRHGVAISFDTQFGSNATTFEDMSPTLKASQQPPSVTGTSVRRLTPVECERLQGFPDGWTEGQSDTQRYKQMGNAVAVPVVEWIIGNICDTL